ncbi:rSAM-modified peptide [Flavobacterium psychroterrae]|uniref:RSAM-modified peptide n=1 Tax=Flavobacterium psychroterrae TaxID=2133767 RepID=A0ABS5P790_9FLAO|nr:rSAM-modified peptide [Flavobacterium psychroterrae]MBS7230178.1 rSAM-modified peptide [Flavobacterium psychroterrae]
MKITKLKLEDFNLEKLTKNHQKEVFGGDGGGGGEEPIDPGKGTGKGGNG